MKQKTQLPSSDILEVVRSKLLNFLSYRDRTVWELRQAISKYLLKYDISADDEASLAEELFEWLEELDFVDDYAFAKNYFLAKTSSSRPTSRVAMASFLRKCGISREIIDKVFADYSDKYDEPILIAEILDKKWRFMDTSDFYKARQKLVKYLLGKGFSSSSIYSVIDTKFKKD